MTASVMNLRQIQTRMVSLNALRANGMRLWACS